MLARPARFLTWLALPALLTNIGLQTTAWASDFVVNSTDNALDAKPGDGVCETATNNHVCTLRGAVAEMMANPGGTITLPAGIFTLNTSSAGPSGGLVLDGDVTIEGAGANATTIDAAGLSRLVLIQSRTTGATAPVVKLTNLTLRNGSTLTAAAADDHDGGAIEVKAGNVTLSNAVFKGNAALQHGGGIHSLGTLELINTTFDGNSAGNFGGAVMSSGPLTVQRSAFYNNQAFEGGALTIIGGSATLSNSTFTANNATDQGGALFVTNGNVVATNLTVTANVADVNRGAGIDLTGGTVSLANSILALNSDPNGNSANCNPAKLPVDSGHNLQFPATSCGSTLAVADPKLGALGDHGGATHTLLPLSASPAIDAINDNSCSLTDQRGYTRVDGNGDGHTACDIGAAEYVVPQSPKADLVVTVSDATDPVFGTGDITYTITVKNKGPATATGVIVTDVLPKNVTVVTLTNGCVANASVVSCTVGELAVGAQKQYQAVVRSALQNPATGSASRVPKLSVADVQVTEGNSGAAQAIFTVKLLPAAAQIVTVDFSTAGITAIAGNDFVTTAGKLTFAVGETTKTISIAINSDTVNEPDETFAIDLANPLRALIANGHASATIVNDDPKRSLHFATPSIDLGLSEAGSLTLVLDGPAPTGGVTVNLLSAPVNLATVPTTVFVAAGRTTANIAITGGAQAGSLVVTASAAGYAGSQATISLKARALSLAFDRSPVGMGRTVVGTVTLSFPAMAITTITLTSTKATVATVPASVSVANGMTSATFLVTGVAAGDSVIEAKAPPTYAPAQANVKVVSAVFTVGSNAVLVGKNLQKSFTVALSVAPPALVDVVATIKDPSVALISNGTKVAGGTSALFPSINDVNKRDLYVQGLVEGKKTEIILSATGYAPAIISVEVTPSGFIFNSNTLSLTSAAAPATVTISPVSLAAGTRKAVEFQALRADLANIEVAVKADSTLAGLFGRTAAGIAGGDISGSIQFDPNAVGVVKATLTQPAGFSEPDDVRTLLTVKVCNVLPCP